MAGKTLNARPAHSMNQRPGATQSKMLPPKGVPTQPRPVAPVQQSGYNMQPSNQAAYQQQSAPAHQQQSVPSYAQQGTPRALNRPNAQPTQESGMQGFVTVLKGMVGSFAILSDEVVAKNLQLAVGNGMTNDDRTISFECAEYLMSNLAHIFMGLVLDSSFKDAFMEALLVEMDIDNQPDEEKRKIREAMKDTKTYNSSGNIVIGLTAFMPHVAEELMQKMQNSFDQLDNFADEFDAEVAGLTTEQKIEYGFIFSNFMYLIRAFTHNDLFMSYVITVIEKVKQLVA